MSKRDELAWRAVEGVETGMLVGLGTGRAATRGVRALGERVRDEGLRVTCVTTSDRTARTASELGIALRDLGEVERLDYLFDGADEVDGALRMIKGGGGAMTREKTAAHMSDRCVYMIQERKRVARLGETFPVPAEVLECSKGLLLRLLRDELSLDSAVRLDGDGRTVHTDNGHPIVDVRIEELEEEDLEGFGAWLESVPGVMAHGLFLDEADEVLVEDESDKVKRLTR